MSARTRHLSIASASGSGEEFKAPRGPVVNAEWIVRHYHTDPDTGKPTLSQRWVKENVPGKLTLSYNVVGWFRDSVVEHYEKLFKATK